MTTVSNQTRIKVRPLDDNRPRPRWSVLIPAYNCANYLEACLDSVLTQAFSESDMEIIVSDDASPEGSPEALVKRIGGERVRFFRQPVNLGHTGNFAWLLNQARGQVTHLLHADDHVLPGFYAAHDAAHRENPGVAAAFCRTRHVDEAGKFLSNSGFTRPKSGVADEDWLLAMCVHNQLQTGSMTVKRWAYEELGAFDSRFGWTEDWEMWGRIGSRFPVFFINEVLSVYRRVPDSNTSKRIRTGENVRDAWNAGRQIHSYLPKVPFHIRWQHKRYCLGIGSSIISKLPGEDVEARKNNLREMKKIAPVLTLAKELRAKAFGR